MFDSDTVSLTRLMCNALPVFSSTSIGAPQTLTRPPATGNPGNPSMNLLMIAGDLGRDTSYRGHTGPHRREKLCRGDPLVGRLDVCVGAYGCRNFPVEKRLITIFSLVVSACMSTMIVEVSCRSCSTAARAEWKGLSKMRCKGSAELRASTHGSHCNVVTHYDAY